MENTTTQESGIRPPALWNPNAAASWSLLFTPAFGAYLHAKNWRALGENERASSSMTWFYVALALLVLYPILGVLVPNEKAAEGFARVLAFAFLLSWYFVSAKAQTKYVKAKYGDAFSRQSWSKPLWAGVGGLVGYFLLTIAIGVVVALIFHQ